MTTKNMLTIVAFLVTAFYLTLGNIAIPAYSFPHQTAQPQVNSDPEINKQIL